MNLLLTITGPLATEEALFARRFLESLPQDIEAMAVVPEILIPLLVGERPGKEPWLFVNGDDAGKATRAAARFGPDLVVVADPLGHSGQAGAPFHEMAPIIALDTSGMAFSLPVSGCLRACPPLPPGPEPSWNPFGGMLANAIGRYATREALFAQHGLPGDAVLAVMPLSLSVQLLAQARLLGGWYRAFLGLLSEHLATLDRPVLLLVATPGCRIEPPASRVKVAAYDWLPPEQLEQLVIAADLVLVEQEWRYWRYLALAHGVPVATLANSISRDESGAWRATFSELAPTVRPWLERLEAEAPHALVPFVNFPNPTTTWHTVAYSPADQHARLDLSDAASCRELLVDMLSEGGRRDWHAAQEAFLGRGRAAPPLEVSLRRWAGKRDG